MISATRRFEWAWCQKDQKKSALVGSGTCHFWRFLGKNLRSQVDIFDFFDFFEKKRGSPAGAAGSHFRIVGLRRVDKTGRGCVTAGRGAAAGPPPRLRIPVQSSTSQTKSNFLKIAPAGPCLNPIKFQNLTFLRVGGVPPVKGR